MKPSLLAVPVAALLLAAGAHAQKAGSSIWRCGNTYTNDAAEAKAKGCKPMEGGNVTVVEGTKVQGNNASRETRVATRSGNSVGSDQQKARDADARAILESELKKAEARREELAKEYNNGEPEMLGPEHRNRQKYLDRVASLKESLARTDNDIAGIKREIARMGSSSSGSNTASSSNGTVPAAR